MVPYLFGDVRVIPNGIDCARFAAPDLTPIVEFDDGRLNLLFVGRLEPRKGFPHLLNAYPQIKQAMPKVRLLVVGAFGDEDKARLAEQVQAQGLRDVHLIGRVSSAELPRYYRTATVFCAPSTGGESFGIVLLEAMAAGVPIVASEIASHYDWSVVAPQVIEYYQELQDTRPQWRAARAGAAPSEKEQRVPAPETVRVVLDIRGDLRLEGWNRPEVVARAPGTDQVHVERRHDTVTITGETPGKDYYLRVPRGAAVRVVYVAGGARVRGLSSSLEIERVGGHVKLEQISGAHTRRVGGHLSAYEIQGPQVNTGAWQCHGGMRRCCAQSATSE